MTDKPSSRASAETLVTRIDREDAASDTVPTGFPSIDRMLGGGLRRRDLVLLAGDVGSGKSALALGLALRVSRAGYPTVYLSGEMHEERLMERALALEGRASIDDLRSGKLKDRTRAAVGAAALGLRDLPLTILELHGEGSDHWGALLARVPRPALLVVDPIQLVGTEASRHTAEETLALAARELKSLALRQNVTVLGVTQVAGTLAGRADARPTLDDLGGLGALKQHADLVLAIYREEMYRPGGGMEGATELIIAKNRNGPTGFVDLYFYQKWLRFEDMLDPEP